MAENNKLPLIIGVGAIGAGALGVYLLTQKLGEERQVSCVFGDWKGLVRDLPGHLLAQHGLRQFMNSENLFLDKYNRIVDKAGLVFGVIQDGRLFALTGTENVFKQLGATVSGILTKVDKNVFKLPDGRFVDLMTNTVVSAETQIQQTIQSIQQTAQQVTQVPQQITQVSQQAVNIFLDNLNRFVDNSGKLYGILLNGVLYAFQDTKDILQNAGYNVKGIMTKVDNNIFKLPNGNLVDVVKNTLVNLPSLTSTLPTTLTQPTTAPTTTSPTVTQSHVTPDINNIFSHVVSYKDVKTTWTSQVPTKRIRLSNKGDYVRFMPISNIELVITKQVRTRPTILHGWSAPSTSIKTIQIKEGVVYEIVNNENGSTVDEEYSIELKNAWKSTPTGFLGSEVETESEDFSVFDAYMPDQNGV